MSSSNACASAARSAQADWLDPEAVARSAANLAEADEALEWATEQEWDRARRPNGGRADRLPPDRRSARNRAPDRRARHRELATEGGGRASARPRARPSARRACRPDEPRRCAECSAPAAPNGDSFRPANGLDLWITSVKNAFNNSGDSLLTGRGAWNRTIAFFVGARTKRWPRRAARSPKRRANGECCSRGFSSSG